MIDYDGKRFRAAGAGPGQAPVALYRQRGDLVWAEFSGGEVRRGSLAGTCAADGALDFAYCMVLADGSVLSGSCLSTPQRLADGRIRLREEWERHGRHAASGVSYLEELEEAGHAAAG